MVTMRSLKNNSVLWFVVLTVALSFATYFLPLPVEQKSLIVPVLMVFIPTIVSIPLAFISEGMDGIRQMQDKVKEILQAIQQAESQTTSRINSM